ncbi:kinase domain-containing protein [Pyrenochaeta sp. DS3sAY3a]|nr:kinase domain-containing protein [Pyrenochaeta sp. DS3sAY3a]
MSASDSCSRRDSGTITPPITPTTISHTKSNSSSSDFLSTLSSLRRGDSTSSRTGPRSSLDASGKPGSAELITYPNHLIDYEIKTDSKGRKKVIGQGAWSDVYFATPTLPKPADVSASDTFAGADATPPITPIHRRTSSLDTNLLPVIPPLYAIKVPAMTSAKKVLSAEARILSYLARFPDAENHVVPFYGQDLRTGALVLKAMDGTLESWIQTTLNTLDESARAKKLAQTFPHMALALLSSLHWLQAHDCTHADIKPANILVSGSSSHADGIPHTVFTDFSSSILAHPSAAITAPQTSPLGAGTWEFLDPLLLSTSSPAPVSGATDLWSLAITLLFVVLGTSPFDAFRNNKFQQREMIKAGAPLQCIGYGEDGDVVRGMRRVRGLERDLGFDVLGWFGKVLVKKEGGRCGLEEWMGMLEGGLREGKGL